MSVGPMRISQGNRGILIVRELRRHWLVYLAGVVLPITLFAIFVGYPLIYSVYLSFVSWNGLSARITFVGFDNYSNLFHDDTFWLSFRNSIKW
ncbi:MAG: hypothetical protein JWO42_1534, partial [Chloroflexi bacterium]|nr:hypothetical protein [Chloroflexota bacterium]